MGAKKEHAEQLEEKSGEEGAACGAFLPTLRPLETAARVFDGGDEDDEEGGPGRARADDSSRLFVLPRILPGGHSDHSLMNMAGFAPLWEQFCSEGELGKGVRVTGHSFRNMGHSFAFHAGVSSDDLRKFAVWLNPRVAAG
jgi:hypothetical protein